MPSASFARAGSPAHDPSLVDCDVHPQFRRGVEDLAPFLSRAWAERVLGNAAQRATRSVIFGIPKNELYINTAGRVKRDSLPPDGSPPASDPAYVAADLLDKYAIDRAVLITNNLIGLGALPDPDLAAALAAAHNDWLSETWLSADARYRGSIAVAAQNPEEAAAEIGRSGGRPSVVQVFLPMINILMGNRHYFPIYEAAVDMDLPIAIHVNAVESMFIQAPQVAGGIPTSYIEWHAHLPEVFEANVISMVYQGIFERFPTLRIVITEGGFAWVPAVIWRMDQDWKALRDDVPWLRQPPSAYVLNHFRFTTQPFIDPDNTSHLLSILDMISAEATMFFSTDYPHWDFDNPLSALRRLPASLQARIMARSALEFYGDRLR